jgi:uncharacterized protein (TIGR02118 family)
MIKVTVLYPNTPGSRFDHDYYLRAHMPLSIERIGRAMKSITVERGVSRPPWPEPAFHAICSFVCESREAYEAAFFPHMAELQGDIPKFTDVQAIVQLSDVALEFTP